MSSNRDNYKTIVDKSRYNNLPFHPAQKKQKRKKEKKNKKEEKGS